MDARHGRQLRFRHAALAGATMVVGLMVHLSSSRLNPVVRDMLGDALWAMMMFFCVGVFLPHARCRTRIVAAFAICAAVEVSQRYHSPRWDAFRATLPGHLILGSGFDPRDFLSYSLGVAAAAALERMGVLGCRRRGSPG